jgi:hypothetical protein
MTVSKPESLPPSVLSEFFTLSFVKKNHPQLKQQVKKLE